MTKQEYFKSINDITAEYKKQIWAIKKQYALSNNPYKIGDIVTDHIGSAKIRDISVISSGDIAECVYVCDNLTKSGTINKKEPTRNVYQLNIKM